MLTDEEEEIFRRGRNAKKPTKSKSASAAEYNRSTGFEAVLGYLHLIGNDERIEELLALTDKELLKGQAAVTSFKP
jgi:ribonuclease-3 family protein